MADPFANPFETPAAPPAAPPPPAPPAAVANPFDSFAAAPAPQAPQQQTANPFADTVVPNNVPPQPEPGVNPYAAAAEPIPQQQPQAQPPMVQPQIQPQQQQQQDPYAAMVGVQQTQPTESFAQQPMTNQMAQQPAVAPSFGDPAAAYAAAPPATPTPSYPAPAAQPAIPGLQAAPAPAPVYQAPADPFAAQQAMVPSVQQSNQWGVQPAAVPANTTQQAIVPATQPANQWGVPAPAPAATNSFDPFAPAPPPAAPAPPPPAQAAPAPPQQYAQQPTGGALLQSQSFDQQAPPQQNPYAQQQPPAQQPYAQQPVEQQLVPHQQQANPYAVQPQDNFDFLQQQAPPPAAAPPQAQPQYGDQQTALARAGENQLAVQGRNGGNELVPYAAPSPTSAHSNKYSEILAQQAPTGSAPLPKAEMVVKSGYVLSRISFRTILLKKWKQSFWCQYGPHTMLWFRSHADFDDWLNNPYHTQAQRNFLIKLAVNFVHDLYKPNVRGYQVTQARIKPYGKQLIRQFKLERWMDYGPTIAAAFGSSDPREVDELRQAIVECMRNTPVGDGIRATGAVRQDHPNQNGEQGEPHQGGQLSQQKLVAMTESTRRASASAAYAPPPAPGPHHSAQSVMSAGDLLDDQRVFDDASSVGPFGATQSVPGNFNHQAQQMPSLLDFSTPAQPAQQPLQYQQQPQPYQQQPPQLGQQAMPPQYQQTQQMYGQPQQQYQQQQQPQAAYQQPYQSPF